MKRSVPLVLCLALSGCGGGGGEGSLFPLWVPTDVVVTDVDLDGRADILTLAELSTSASRREGRLTVYRQTSPGTFAPPESYVVGTFPWKLAVGDLDADGLPDLLVTDPDGRAVWLLLQDPNGTGRLLPPVQVASGLLAYEAAIADLDGDDLPDISMADARRESTRLVVRHQDPAHPGTFLPEADVTVPGAPFSLAAGDLDGDGRADLITWIYLPGGGITPRTELVARFQQPDGTLGPTTTLATHTGLNPQRVSITDYNGDGREDIIVFSTPFSSDFSARLTVLLQEAVAGTFGPPVETSLAGVRGIDAAAVADLNDDGLPDAAVIGFFPVGSPSSVDSRLNLFLQSGDGGFAPAQTHGMPLAASRVGTGDVDGDGRTDLVVLGGDNVCLQMLQSPTAPGVFSPPGPL